MSCSEPCISLLTPNEKSRIVDRETRRRRILRLLQVREQSRANAAAIRDRIAIEIQSGVEQVRRKLEEAVEQRLVEIEPRIRTPSRPATVRFPLFALCSLFSLSAIISLAYFGRRGNG